MTWNLPNQISMTRVWLSIAVFVALHFQAFSWAIFLFAVTAGTDWLDGWLARRWNQVTQMGRILDPLADKVVVCGTFIFLATERGSEIQAWMAVVVVARELIVTVVRSFLEQEGEDFSAQWSGKLKMVFQCVAALASMWLLWRYASGVDAGWLKQVTPWLVWVAILLTVYSGVVYIAAARRLLLSPDRS